MEGGAWCDYLFAPIRRPPAPLPPLSLSLIRPTAAPSAPQSPSCHSGRPSDWKQSGLWWHNYSDPLTSRCCHNQALIRLLWASFSLQRRLIWASDGRVMGTGAGAAVRRSERAPASASLDIVCLSIIVTKSCLNLTLWKSHFLPFCFFCAFFFSSRTHSARLSPCGCGWGSSFILYPEEVLWSSVTFTVNRRCLAHTSLLSLCLSLSPSLLFSVFLLSLILFLFFSWMWKGGGWKKLKFRERKKDRAPVERYRVFTA